MQMPLLSSDKKSILLILLKNQPGSHNPLETELQEGSGTTVINRFLMRDEDIPLSLIFMGMMPNMITSLLPLNTKVSSRKTWS